MIGPANAYKVMSGLFQLDITRMRRCVTTQQQFFPVNK